ncbi:ricin-type beta-trefoil lectin domain protein [Streptomyces sp. NPDC058619]|uniref:ricin-type beta-trefoil lectin domain protein n=1 Tax=Streptomyces sp. NPDC058619 TaxID=3346559 RepID=UPI00364788FE
MGPTRRHRCLRRHRDRQAHRAARRGRPLPPPQSPDGGGRPRPLDQSRRDHPHRPTGPLPAAAAPSRTTVRTCDGSAGQTWQAGPQGTLRNAGQCLAPAGSATGNGTTLGRAACDGTPAQRWTFTP